MPDTETVAEQPDCGLDHGAYVPLTVMYPDADIPVLQMSMPDLDPEHLFAIGRRLQPLRDEGVLIMGSGFLTHGLPFLRDWRPDAPPPGWSEEFDLWAAEALRAGRRRRADGLPAPRARHAVRAPDGGALRAAVRDARRRQRPRGGPRHRDRGVLPGPREALVRRGLHRPTGSATCARCRPDRPCGCDQWRPPSSMSVGTRRRRPRRTATRAGRRSRWHGSGRSDPLEGGCANRARGPRTPARRGRRTVRGVDENVPSALSRSRCDGRRRRVVATPRDPASIGPRPGEHPSRPPTG